MESAVWVTTEPTLDGGGYVVTLEASDDSAITLTPDSAARYALGVLDAAHRAAYDAAVLRQLVNKLRVPLDEAGGTLMGMRADRPPLSPEATAPLELEPGVTAPPEMRPFLTVKLRGSRLGQWSVDDARQHALEVLESVVVADLDSGYYRMLRGSIELDEPRARAVVQDVGNHRH